MNKRNLVSQILLVDGILLIAVAFVQLFATPLISKWLVRELTPEALANISPPFLLNHIVVGILLIPFGVSTLYSSVGVQSGQRWARGIVMVNAIVVMILPILLVILMGPQFFKAASFLVVGIVMTVVGVSMIIPLIWLRNEPKPDRHFHIDHHHF